MQDQFLSRVSTALLSCSLVVLTACGEKSNPQANSTSSATPTWVSPSYDWDASYFPPPSAVQLFTDESGIGGLSHFPNNACSHQYGQPPPFPIIDNNTGKPLDPQPYLSTYPCIPPEIMKVCSHQPGEPTQGVMVDPLTHYALDTQPTLKYYACGEPELLWTFGKNYTYWDLRTTETVK